MTADRYEYRVVLAIVRCALAALVSIGCRDGGEDARQIRADTLESGTIVVRNGSAGAWSEAEAWRAVEVVRIGSEEAIDPALLFGDVWDVTLDELGRIYVLDRQPKAVRIFDRTGRHVRTLGREGGGPGEFRNPTGLAWGPAGNLWVVDVENARYSVFDTAGDYLHSYRREIGGWGYPWGGGFDASGALYEPSYYQRSTGESMRVYIRHSVSDGVTPRDTFSLPDYDASQSTYRIERRSGATVVGIPFAPQLRWRFDGVDGIWFGVNASYRLYHRRLGGDTIRIVERAAEPIPVEASDRDAVRDRFARYGDPAVNAIIARMPDAKPAFEDFVVDDVGYLWVIRTSPTRQDRSLRDITFDVFDSAGVYLGGVDADIGMYPPPRIVGDQLVGVIRDPLDTPYVVLYRIDGRPASPRSNVSQPR